jgi:hypothetical protein
MVIIDHLYILFRNPWDQRLGLLRGFPSIARVIHGVLDLYVIGQYVKMSLVSTNQECMECKGAYLVD